MDHEKLKQFRRRSIEKALRAGFRPISSTNAMMTA